jgi:hypothetical protein
MFQIHEKIILMTLTELESVNPDNVDYILNCDPKLNNIMNHPNYLNINITIYNMETLPYFDSIYKFLINQLANNKNIILLGEDIYENPITFAIYFLMRYHNLPFDTIYHQLDNTLRIRHIFFYYALKSLEQFIIKKDQNSICKDDMVN